MHFLFALVIGACASCDEKPKTDPNANKQAPAPPASSTPAPPKRATFSEEQLNPFQPLPAALENPQIDEPVKLGRALWFDARLSKGKDVSCNSCHDLAKAGVDGQPTSTGTNKASGKRNTPTVINAAGSFAQGWDARATTIEELVVPHMIDAAIMGMGDEKALVSAVTTLYGAQFKKAFPDEKAVTAETIAQAYAAYVKKLFARSRWDKFLAGDKSQLKEEELTGFATFVEAGCTSCHQGKYIGGTNAQRLGIAKPWPPPAGSDPGRFDVTKQEADRGLFKVPTLRNVTRTGPWLHDGSIASLEEVVRLMAKHQVGKEISEDQAKAIVTFLGTLTGDPPKELLSKSDPAPK
jgi:cytochrome c peroxidase